MFILAEDSTTPLTAIIISGSSMFATLCVVLVALFLYKNMKKKAKARNTETTDHNPIYGQYYFPEGTKIDESNVEVEDQNDAYEEQYDELVE